MKIKSDQIVYSEHGEDECCEYTNDSGRVPDGVAIGYAIESNAPSDVIILFDDIKYSECDHDYWDNHELEHDVDRVVVG